MKTKEEDTKVPIINKIIKFTFTNSLNHQSLIGLSDIQKLQYLRATLTDEASNVLSPLEISEANYAVAWDLLKERFDNKRDIVQTHLKSIIELPVMTKENVVELRQIADGSARHMLALKALKRPTEHWDDLLVYLLSSKLDPTTEREWRLSLKDSELPTLKQFHAFLAHRCQAIESTGTCRICSRKHNTLLHIPESSDRNKASDDHKEEASSSESTNTSTPHAVVSHASNTVDSKCILLSTAVALVQSKNGSLQPCRVLLDSGSQANFISKDTLNTLGLIPRSIDISISDTFWNLICVGQIKPSQKHPTLQKTRLGWILAGRLNNSVMNSRNMQSFHASLSNSELNEQLSKFWQLDEIHYKSNSYTLEESFCVKHFLENVSTNEQGRYIVKLPLKEELIVSIGNSRNIALSRLQGLERRFVRDPHLKKRYSDFIDEYLTLGHMKPIVEQSSNESGAYYLPHHCVLKESAKSTKLRVVFDGSCKTDTGISLNDSMMIGPVVQEDLMSILMRFRIYIYVIVADIIKMYRQILLHPSQTKLQRILWRLMSDLDVKIYELLTVTYGTAAASFLATMCLKHLAEKYAHVFPIGSLHVIRNFYGDDLLTGANTISEAMVIRDQVVQLLKLASFELSKWGSNCPELLNGVSDQSEGLVPFDKDSDFRILGILWDRDDDTFRFSYKPSQQPNVWIGMNRFSKTLIQNG
ncbi:uncharacterized protein [Temnothorax longispinosus]|uniref:uncharacterized protein n=1 Tax=Temnothorax longispinosus TaxID=300112 RepID=UPI003A99058E